MLQFKPDEKKMFKSRYQSLNQANIDQKDGFQSIDAQKLLNDFPLEDKLRLVLGYHKTITKKWKENYDKIRETNVPSIVCRMCDRNFYADKGQIHNKVCYDRQMKVMAQKDLNTEFISLSNLATEIMTDIRQNNVMQTPELRAHSKFGNILQTPTMQRRALLGPSLIEQGTGQKQMMPNRFAAGNRAFSISGGIGINKLTEL